jgi:hypothetical protein
VLFDVGERGAGGWLDERGHAAHVLQEAGTAWGTTRGLRRAGAAGSAKGIASLHVRLP